MNNATILYTTGQRVRIDEQDEPATHVGKMAVVERVELPEQGEPVYALRVDRVAELISLPQHYLKPIIAIPSSLLANDLFLPWDMDDPQLRLREFTQDRWLAGHILESLLFYDKIVVPTVDYSVIVPLAHWLGIGLLREMLNAEALSFVRITGTLGYSGNGVGLVLFEIQPGQKSDEVEKPGDWWVRAARCSPQEAVALQIQHRLSGLQEGLVDVFARLVQVCTVDTVLPQFKQKVEEETYRDILGSDILRLRFSIRNTNLKRLVSLQPNQVRTFTRLPKPAVAGDEIDITLRLAMLNLEVYLAEEAGARDMVTDRDFGSLLEAKVQRYTSGRMARDSFSRLLTIEGVPDLVSSIRDGAVDLVKVWQFRNTKNACQFRQWFDKVGSVDPTKFTQEYVKMLRDTGWWSGGRAKLMRFLVLQAVGAALAPSTGAYSFIASLGLSAVDSFLLDKIRLGYNPRYFIDELRHDFFSR